LASQIVLPARAAGSSLNVAGGVAADLSSLANGRLLEVWIQEDVWRLQSGQMRGRSRKEIERMVGEGRIESQNGLFLGPVVLPGSTLIQRPDYDFERKQKVLSRNGKCLPLQDYRTTKQHDSGGKRKKEADSPSCDDIHRRPLRPWTWT
jgi:hypothetical protein